MAERIKTQRAAYARVSRRDGGRCRVCGKRSRAEKHHVLPRSLGGKDEPSNLMLDNFDMRYFLSTIGIPNDAVVWGG